MKKTATCLIALSLFMATPTYSAATFTDMVRYDETTQHAVNYLVEKQIIKGTSVTTFSPAREITRGQVVKMLGRYLQSTGKNIPTNWETKARFTDVSLATTDRELLQYAALVYDEGVFVGSEGKLNAAGMLTRENLVLVLSRLAKDANLAQYVEDKGLTSNVKDLAAVKEEAKEAVQLFNALGISNVDVFNPKNAVLRVHFASFLAKLLQTMEDIEQEQVDEHITEPGTTTDEEKSDGEGETSEIIEEKPSVPESNSEIPIAPPSTDEETLAPILPEEDEEEEEPTYTFELEDIENAEIVRSSSGSVTIRYNNELVQLGIDEALASIFNEEPMLQGAIVSLSIEDDVVTTINSLEITANGSASSPIIIDGTLFEEVTPIVIRSQYANVINFGDYYETVQIEAPANAVYVVGEGEFETITAKHSLRITFTGVIEHEVTLKAPSAKVTIAHTASIETLTATEALSIEVQDGGHLQDLYLPAHVDTLTMQGEIISVTADTTSSFILNGSGTIYELYGEATAVYVQADGVIVNGLYVDPSVDAVTVK